jgi:signal transduction histidine kinase
MPLLRSSSSGPFSSRALPPLLAALAFGGGALLLQFLLNPHLPGAPFLLLYPALFLISHRWGLVPGLATIVLCTLGADWLFFEPRFSLRMAHTEDAVRLAVFSGLSGFVVWLICRGHTEQERRARDVAERQKAEAALSHNEEVLRLLAEAAVQLSRSLAVQETLETLARLAVPTLADWCTIDLYKEGPGSPLERVLVYHPGKPELAAELREHPVDLAVASALEEALRSGQPFLLIRIPPENVSVERFQGTPHQRHLELARALGLRSLLCVPLRARDKALGTVCLFRGDSGLEYSEKQLAPAMELVNRAALALDNARLYEAAQRAIRLRDEFLGIASHELRTPLTSLKLQTQILQRTLARHGMQNLSEETLQKALAIFHRQLGSLAGLIEDLLDVSRIANGRLSIERAPTFVLELVQEVVERFREQFQHADAPFTVDLPLAPELVARWDRLRIEQVLTNLLSNALKYGGGTPVGVCARLTGERVELSVSDQGVGIPPEHHARIFQRFERAVEGSGISGLGLGLYIVREIVSAHGGDIHVRSAPGQGATFTVSLPLHSEVGPSAST